MKIGGTQWGVGGAGNGKHTHTHDVPVIHRVVEPRAMIRSNHDACRRGPPLIKLMGYEHLEDALGGGRSRQRQTHTHTEFPSRYTGWMEPRARMGHVSVAPTN